jgi:hypothetical protein
MTITRNALFRPIELGLLAVSALPASPLRAAPTTAHLPPPATAR